MSFLSLLSFFFLVALSSILLVYTILLGIAPGMPPLDLGLTRFFVYGPGPGFLWLVGWLFLVSVIHLYALLKKRRARSSSHSWHWASWIGLGLLLFLEGVIIADFQGIL